MSCGRARRIIMIRRPITINLSTGLEARPVAQLVQVASRFNSEIFVEIGKKKVNAKSIMGMMTLGLDAGEEVTLSANGEDEEAAMTSIEQYLSNRS
jgi:catabolite repression HPr-like protein